MATSPLVRKLNALGTRSCCWAGVFLYRPKRQGRETRTAQVLLEEVTYPVLMHQIIDDRSRKGDPRIDQLFVPHKDIGPFQKPSEAIKKTDDTAAFRNDERLLGGKIQALREGLDSLLQ